MSIHARATSGPLPARRMLPVLLLALFLPGAPHAEAPARPAPSLAGASGLIAGHFQLRDPSGRTVDSDALAGTPYGVFFGFTQCPDICPTTLSRLSAALRPIADQDLRIYFITVDPERDTPAVLGAYMESFDPRIVALSGDRAAVDEAIASFGIVAERSPLPDGRYTYGHTAAVLLVDENGLVAARIAADADLSGMTGRLVRLARPRTEAAGKAAP